MKINTFKIIKLLILSSVSSLILLVILFFPNNIKVAQAASDPDWWGGTTCDTAYHSGSSWATNNYNTSQKVSLNGVKVCGPGPNDNPSLAAYPADPAHPPSTNPPYFDGHSVTSEWYCTELAERYLFQVYGVTPYPANGSAIVASLPTSYSSTVQTVTNGQQTPQDGDIISYGTSGNPYDIYNTGHVAIVIDNSGVNGSGTGTITVMQENSSGYYEETEPITSNVLAPLSGDSAKTVEGWLHYKGSSTPASLKVASGVTAPSSAMQGTSFSTSFTLTNSGDSSFNFTQLGVYGIDQNNNHFLVGTNAMNSVAAHTTTGTITITGGNFGNSCAPNPCVTTGSYQIMAEYQDGSGWHNIGANSGATNPVSTYEYLNSIVQSKKDVGVNYDGSPQVFKRDKAGYIWTSWENGPSGAWGNWINISPNGPLSADPTIIMDQNNKLEAYSIGATDGNLYVNTENSVNGYGSWTGWVQSTIGSPPHLSGQLTAIRQTNNNLAVYAHASDGNIYYAYQDNNGNWQAWTHMSNAWVFNSNPSVALDPSGRLDIFALVNNNTMDISTQNNPNDNSSWGSWAPISGNAQAYFGDPVAVNQPNGNIDVFGRGTDYNIYHNYQDAKNSNNWTGAQAMTSGWHFDGAPSVITNSDGRMNIFARINNDTIDYAYQSTPGDENTWTGFNPRSSTGFKFYDPMAVSKSGTGNIDLYAPTFNNDVYRNYQLSNGTWSDWTPRIVRNATQAQTFNVDGTSQVFMINSNGQLKTNWQTSIGGSWNGWTNLPTNTYGFTGTLAVIQNQVGQVEVFAKSVSPDSRLYYTNQNTAGSNSSWANWTQLTNYQAAGNPVVIAQDNGALDLYVRTNDNNIQHIYQNSVGSWGGTWAPLSNSWSFNADPAVIEGHTNGQLYIFARDNINNVQYTSETTPGDETSWGISNWQEINQTNWTISGNPVVALQADGYIDVFGRGSDNNVSHNYQDNNGNWTGWIHLSDSWAFNADPAVISNLTAGSLQIFSRVNDNSIYSSWESTPNWETTWITNGWPQHLAPTNIAFSNSNPIAVKTPKYDIDVYAIDSNGNMYHDYQDPNNGDAWSGWVQI